MPNCCNDPIIPPAQCTPRCDKLVDACCVVNEDALPCIIPPVVTTGSGLVGQYVINVTDVTGITVGMVAASVAPGVAVGAVVTKIVGLVVTLDKPNVANWPGAASEVVSFTKIEIRQCDINAAVDAILCDIQDGGVPCLKTSDFNATTLVDPISELDWNATSPVQYSDPFQCQVRLRGILQAEIDAVGINHINTQLFVIPAGPSRPAITKVLSVTVVVNPVTIQGYTRYISGIVSVNASTGAVLLSFSNYNPLVPIASGCADCDTNVPVASYERAATDGGVPATRLEITVSLDGLTYETAA